MTLIEGCGVEALLEMLALLEERVRRSRGGACQISSDTIKKFLVVRFGLKGGSVLWLQNFVEGYLRGSGICTVSHVTQSRRFRRVIYNVDPKQLQLHLLVSSVIDT